MATKLAVPEAEKYQKRIYDCVITSVLMHRSLTLPEIEQCWYTDHEPLFLSEALIKAGFPTILDFLRHYPDEVRIEQSSYIGHFVTTGPRPPQVLQDNIRLIRQTKALNKPNPHNVEKGILSRRLSYLYARASERAEKAAKLLPPPKKPSVGGPGVAQSLPGNSGRTSGLLLTPTVALGQENGWNAAVPSVNGNPNSGRALSGNAPTPGMMLPSVATGLAGRTTMIGGVGHRIGSIYPPATTFLNPTQGRLPAWHPDTSHCSRSSFGSSFVPRSVKWHPMSNNEFLSDNIKVDADMEKIAEDSAKFRASSYLPPPDYDDSDDEDYIPVEEESIYANRQTLGALQAMSTCTLQTLAQKPTVRFSSPLVTYGPVAPAAAPAQHLSNNTDTGGASVSNIFFGFYGLRAEDTDDSDSAFVWSSASQSSSPSQGLTGKAAVVTSRFASSPRGKVETVRVLQAPTTSDEIDDDPTPDIQPSSSSPKDKSLIGDLFASLAAGGQTSLENNVLNIQSSNTHLTHTDGGPFIGGTVVGPQPGPPPPPPPAIISGGGPPVNQFGNVFQQLPPPGQFAPNLPPAPVPGNCQCMNPIDCRDIAGFARNIRRMRQDFCAIGSALCCSDPRPGRPFGPQPGPIIAQPGPGPIGGPVIVSPPIGGPGRLPPMQCGRKGGNPLARTLDIGNPHDVAEFGEYPWMAAILRLDLTYICGAVLIDVNVALTAAHCVARIKGEEMIIRLGEYDVGEQQELPFQDIHVRNVIINAGYHSGTLRNDIAILILDAPARFSSYIKPVCLPPPQDMSGLVCTVTGWGRNRPRGHFSPILKEVDLPIIDNGRCEAQLRGAPELGPIFNLHPSMLCAGLPGKDACSGDGGSPLVCNVDGAWRLAGLVSWGIGCGQYPGVYTRVASFVPWINDVMSRV